MYLNQSPFDAAHFAPYSADTQTPKLFAHASLFDPQLFSRMDEFADNLLKGNIDGKYSPVEVAQWLEDGAQSAGEALTHASHLSGLFAERSMRTRIDLEQRAA